jgi:hypothetical protein
MSAAGDLSAEYWMRLAVSRDGDEAQVWRQALEDAGVAVEVRIADALSAQPGSSPLTAIGGAPQEFAYLVFVPREARDQAAAALIDAGWRPGRELRGVSAGVVLRGALIAAGVAIVLIVLRVAIG